MWQWLLDRKKRARSSSMARKKKKSEKLMALIESIRNKGYEFDYPTTESVDQTEVRVN